MSLAFEIANALLNAGMIKDEIGTAALEGAIARCFPTVPAGSKKKIHWTKPNSKFGGPACGDAGGSPVLIPDKSQVTCRRCRGMYVFDDEVSPY
jgi:hypothetical protein